MKKWFLSIVLCLLSTVSFAVEHSVQAQVKGQGPTRDKAIQNGLYIAVCKVQGVAVSSSLATVDVRTGNLDVIRDLQTGSKKIEVEGVSASTAGTLALSEARGLVKSFEITDETQISPDVYEVSLNVLVYDYQSPEDTKKIRLAIFPFQSEAQTHRFGNITISGRRLGEQFSQYLTTMLARNEKFTVLDRDSQAAILKEKQILISQDAPLEEKVRLGEVLGADYMLTGTIPQGEIIVEEKFSPIIGAATREFKAYMEAEYRLIVGPTRQVASSDQLRIRLEDEQVRSLMEKWESDDIDYNQMEQKLVERAAKRIADMVSDYLYPIRIAAVRQGDVVILNQGGKRFAEGDTLTVSKAGSDITDPETGKSLGKEETQLATVKITKVLPRIAYAVLTQGTAADEMVGGICRPVRTDGTATSQTNRPSNVRQSDSGGVKLPFDQRQPSQLIKDK